MCERVAELSTSLDPIRLLRQMRAHQQRVVDIADQPVAEPKDTAVPPLEQFLAGLRTAWAEGGARPTAKPAAKPKRERLQAAHPDALLRTVQRRVKVWHREKATAMVFGELPTVEHVADVK